MLRRKVLDPYPPVPPKAVRTAEQQRKLDPILLNDQDLVQEERMVACRVKVLEIKTIIPEWCK